MRLVCIASLLPYPLDGGGNVRITNHLRALAAKHDVLLLAGERPDTDDTAIAQLRRGLDIEVAVYQPFGHRGKVRSWRRALALGCPPYISAQMADGLRRRLTLEEERADVIVALDDYAAVYFSALKGRTLTVLDKHRMLAPEHASRLPHGVGSLSDVLLVAFERRAIERSTVTVVTSDAEFAKLQARHSPRASELVPSEPERLAVERIPDGRTVAWLGAHAYDPNRDGLERFLNQGWDLVGHGACLLIAGRGPSSDLVRRAESRRDIEVLGFVEDLPRFLSRPVAAVVPLWAGGGVKVKTVTFMEAGVPVVGTQAALEGLGAEHGVHAILAETPEALGHGLRRLFAEPELAEAIGRKGKELMQSRRESGVGAPAFANIVGGLPLRPL